MLLLIDAIPAIVFDCTSYTARCCVIIMLGASKIENIVRKS